MSLDLRGEIGEIYLYEHGMHMFYVSANIYDSSDPDELIEECCILHVDNIVLSELLTCLQNEIDPDRTNKELSENILKADPFFDYCRLMKQNSGNNYAQS